MRSPGLALAALLALAAASAARGQDLAHGEAVFLSRCQMCHALDGPGQGPDLKGVVGRKAGGAADFNYSDPMSRSGLTWTPEILDRFLAAPSRMVPGSPMQAMVPDPAERRDLIAYLASLKGSP